jgi:hypothetical protein
MMWATKRPLVFFIPLTHHPISFGVLVHHGGIWPLELGDGRKYVWVGNQDPMGFVLVFCTSLQCSVA